MRKLIIFVLLLLLGWSDSGVIETNAVAGFIYTCTPKRLLRQIDVRPETKSDPVLRIRFN